jgi:MFS family permease
MEDKIISEKESMLLIQQMITTAKKEQTDSGVGWIVWGWLLFFASIFTYLNEQYNWLSTFFFWNMFGIAAILMVLYEVAKYFFGTKTEKVKTYTGDLFDRLNIGFGISLLLIIMSMNINYPSTVPPVKGFTLLLGLYGFWILIYGTVLNFKPSIIGAFITWGFAFAGLFVHQGRFDITMILHAAAVLCGYIIPGHIANVQFRNLRNQKF